MSLMINQNITSLNAWRNLSKTDRSMSSTMEKLSSGLRINRASDDPSGLIISEQMRAQVVGLNAAVKNSEKGISMIQTAEGALDKVHALLDKMRGLALDSANSGANDANMLAANQAEITNILETITRISDNTTYGTKLLLNGANANTATVTSAGGTGISSANVVDVNGLSDGVYDLAVTVNTAGTGVFNAGTATGATMNTSSANAAASLSEATHNLVIAGTTMDSRTFAAGTSGATSTGITGAYHGSTSEVYTFTTAGAIADVSDAAAHTYSYSNADGTKTGTISLTSSAAGALTAVAAGAVTVATGTNADLLGMAGNLDGVLAAGASFSVTFAASAKTASLDGGTAATLYTDTGDSTVLTSGLTNGGSADFDLNGVAAGTVGTATVAVTKTTYNATLTEASTGAAGTAVTGFKASAGQQTFSVGANSMTVNMSSLTGAGNVQFTNADNSLVFQVGANQNQTVKISIQDVSVEMMATNVTNDSGFASLADINISTSAKATDSLKLIDQAIDQVSVIRGNLGAFQANTLEANLDSLRVASENLQASESIIRDTDMAAEMATFTKFQIMMQAGTAMLAQANQIPNNILQLLKG